MNPWAADDEALSVPSSRHWLPHGAQIIPIEAKAFDPIERLVLTNLFNTVIDCYMISQGRWQFFRQEGWHGKKESERTWSTACNHVLEWINSDRFAFQLKYFGWNCNQARGMLCEVLNGQHRDQIESLIEKPHNPSGKGGFTTRG